MFKVIKDKNSKKGFIATSLIYSFFLVFLALLLAILSTHISTNRILSTYNKSVKNKLNNMTNVPSIYSLGNDFYVERGVSNDIFTSFFKTFNMPTNPIMNDDYVCTYFGTTTTIYNTQNLVVSSEPYSISCKVRNKNIDERYLSMASVNIYVVESLVEA